ncbi:hypothetical protein N7486_009057 [Penicillium sp. IBT 16267x]|nr:hypothetical protein N7486_009057 [Penicillium sp. IBT 16267x]
MTYKDLGKMRSAAALQDVFHINQKICGRGHPRTLAAMNDLVSTYWEQGQWQEVETLGVEVWAGFNRILASEDSDDRGVTPSVARALAVSRESSQSCRSGNRTRYR